MQTLEVGNQYYLTRAQYETRKSAGLLETGGQYYITDEQYVEQDSSGNVTIDGTLTIEDDVTFNADAILHSSSGDISLRSLQYLPIGAVVPFAGATIPNNWLICNGASLLRTEYPELYNAIGTTYGAVDSRHFNIPNLQGKVITGVSSTDHDFDLGDTGGEKAHTLTIEEMPSHTHAQNVTANIYSDGPAWRSDFVGDGTGYSKYSQGIDTDPTGGGEAHNNLQPYLTLNYIICSKVVAGGGGGGTGTRNGLYVFKNGDEICSGYEGFYIGAYEFTSYPISVSSGDYITVKARSQVASGTQYLWLGDRASWISVEYV